MYQAGNWPKCSIFQKGSIGRESLTPHHPVLIGCILEKIQISRALSLWWFNQQLKVRTSYPLAATRLTYLDFRQGLFSFLDPAKAVEIARLKQWTGSLLKKHGLQDRGERREEEKSWTVLWSWTFVFILFQLHGDEWIKSNIYSNK